MKKVLAILIAIALVAVMALPAFAYTITITPDSSDTATHTYEAYQIFTGDLSTETDPNTGAVTKTLANIEWGSGIDSSKSKANLVAFLNTKAGLTGADALTVASPARDFAKAMEKLTADADKEALAEELEKLLSTTHTDAVKDGNVYKISTDTAGYYLIKDKDGSLENAVFGAYTKYILQVVSDVDVAEKASVPGVDKQVVDTDGIASEVASYGLYKDIPFILTASIPADVALQDYDHYYVEFADTFTTGLTFKQIDSVVIAMNGWSKTLAASDYDLDTDTQSFNLKIEDILPLFGTQNYAGKDITITVNYTGFLNENAVCYNDDAVGEIANRNDVELIYSNNPNTDQDGKGKTNKDYVFVFTYKVDNTKYQNAVDDANVMAGAGFTVYDNSTNAPVTLIWDATKDAYRPVKAGETGVTEIFSQADGKFNIIGLDEGTYTLKETTTPPGFNTCDNITIVIDADITEDASGTTATLDMERSQNLVNEVINHEGSVLPSTGGMGTTILYIVGAILVIVAGVVLIARRKAGAKA